MIDVEKIIRQYITKTVHMSLATVSVDKPWVCEVHFAYDDDLNLYWRSNPARRHSVDLESNANVAGNIVATYDLETGCGGAIYFEGTAQRLNSEEEVKKAFPVFAKCLNKTEEIIDDALSGKGNVFYKVTVNNWAAFGEFDGQPMQKYELAWNGGKGE